MHSARKIGLEQATIVTHAESPKLGRRSLLRALLAGSIFIASGSASLFADDTAGKKRNGRLVTPTGIDTLRTRSKLVLELAGELRIEEPDPKKEERVRKAEVKSKSTLDYFETISFNNDQPTAAMRKYVTATCENWVAGSASSFELRPECRETRVLLHDGSWQQYSDAVQLDRREVELLQSPINTLALDLLLPAEPAKANEPWSISRETAKELFNLEAVHRSTLSARVTKVEKGMATIEIEGELDATANSVSTTLKVTGNLNAKLGTECAYINWLGLSIHEERSISQSEPGFAITARVSLLRAELQTNETPIPQHVAAKENAGAWLIRLQSVPGRYSMLADRRWTTYVDGGEDAILRMIENNNIIAQCNISQLPKMDAGTQLTLEGFQEEIRKSLGESFISFEEASEKATSTKLRLLRVVAQGQLEEVPIQWIFCHLSDDSGRRTALEFTFGGNLADRFASADEQMTASFEFLAQPATDTSPTAAPTPAKMTSKPTAESKK